MAEGKGSQPDISTLKCTRIGRLLIAMGKVTSSQVARALYLQENNQQVKLGQMVVELGYCNNDDVNSALTSQAWMRAVDVLKLNIPKDVIDLLPAATAHACQVIPISFEKATNTLIVCLGRHHDVRAVADLQILTGYAVLAIVVDGIKLAKKIRDYYGEDSGEHLWIGGSGYYDPDS